MLNTLYSLCMHGTGSTTETAVHRYPTAAKRGLTESAPPNVETVYDALLHRERLEPDKTTMGRRRVLSVSQRPHDATGRPWTYFRLGDYEWLTYREIKRYTAALGAGLAHLGLSAGGRVAIYAPTSREWTLCMLACYSQALQVVTAYDTLGAEGLLHAVNEGEARVVFVKADQLPTVLRIAERMPRVQTVVYYRDAYGMPAAAHAALAALRALKRRVLAMDEVHAYGVASPRDAVVAGRDDTALVMYTSGTTGPPKGVLIAHGGLLAVCGAIHELVPSTIDYGRDHVLSYLPLSHVLAFFVETYCVYSGIRIGYGTPRTLTEESMEPGGLGDLRALRPAVMLGVPQVWNAMRATVLRQVARRPWAVQRLFHGAVALKTWLVQRGLPTGLLDAVVFRRTRQATGGRLKIAITGGAPVNARVQRFIAAAVCPMLHGYGLSEASGLVAVQLPGDASVANVGPPVPSVEMKLVDAPDAGYYARHGQGEVWVRGPSVFQGYLNDAELTRRTVTADGWLRTGDIGQWTPRGQLQIIDRRKNLVKLAHGEYVALEALEAAYSNSQYVANICVCADARMPRPCAVVNVDAAHLERWARDAGIAYVSPADLPTSHAFVQLVLCDLAEAARLNGLPRQEVLADICIDPVLWTPENGMLTAASKLRRADILRRNHSHVQEMYSRCGLL
ncbi:long-chain fatty acid-CoA ligase [Coemansia erecta]|uniref:Long-chain fatty acid-CoA ligase n=1 Tax=Coemansia erecta TaxID=147472 RepID=A0A9W8CRG1_9FUNG|nr:long-chain fatty acid-CoA ligase [Coemansia erecta]